ncbi:hypothetical protein BKP37_04305 [Anaerobacillus alkalilacustris]|uniref:Thiamin pyrophosphokinase catalytic domain-containing protein n=1 Tax=Anaerobacillus alkalilacustris TaxID=393763 RepID=A0A1S2LXG6_9BACI|nr:putative cytokinetic ring protein SteA [Anaerobacillus alkalilacustris]OIJ16890.1 hypothetical protein BKP37_04305 [Anaerobacillus alkalilacustris]
MFPFEKIKGLAFQDEKTKRLVKRLKRNNIAVIDHQDIDVTAAQMLIDCGVKAVVNLSNSMTGIFIHDGVEVLLNAKIPVFDVMEDLLDINVDGKFLLIKENCLFVDSNGIWEELCTLKLYNSLDVKYLKEKANLLFPEQFKAFVGNSLYYGEKELEVFVQEVKKLPILRQLFNKEVLVVARGANYERDLKVLKPILKRKKLTTIAVDGGADGLLKNGKKPDYIIGDMDSVSEKALKSGAVLIVHTYCDGRAPGEARVRSLQIPYEKLTFIGTSEDIAIIFAYCSGANKIYTLGTRVGMNEFLEKGRIGMGSSLLTRMKVGHALVDLKGIHTLLETKEDKTLNRVMVLPAFLSLVLLSISQRFELFLSLVFQWWSGR